MQGRGLKPQKRAKAAARGGSPLMQGRGLKRTVGNRAMPVAAVAPHAGAWVETLDAQRRYL